MKVRVVERPDGDRRGPPTETEIKLRLSAAQAGRDALVARGRRRSSTRATSRTTCSSTTRRARCAPRGSVLRLRRTPRGGVLTFKGPRRSRGRAEDARGDRDRRGRRRRAAARSSSGLGFRRGVPLPEVPRDLVASRARRSWWTRRRSATSSRSRATPDGIHAVAAALGFAPADYITESYVGLFFAAGGQGDMVFPA